MELIQLKIRGLGNVPETSWMPVNPTLTIIQVRDKTAARHLMGAIQTINPPYSLRKTLPFQTYPKEITTDTGYRKRLQPSKRTVVLAVFNSRPSLVAELGSISDIFYETDRIEVGRKLDYSRWISFVELASSSRWSEVSIDVQRLLDAAPMSVHLQEKVLPLMDQMKSTDRIKGETMSILDDWLTDLRARHGDTERIDSVIEKVRRAAFFADAHRVINNRMPLFLLSGPEKYTPSALQDPCAGTGKSNPFPAVVLMDLLDNSDRDVTRLLDSLHDTTASQNQYLCFIHERCPLQERFRQIAVSDRDIISADAPEIRHTR